MTEHHLPLDLAPYIEDLLYQHDCVILPTIGGFIVNAAPATLDVVEQEVLPPSRVVSFNAKLVSNDGLLVHHMAQKEHLTYKQAATQLEAATRQLELLLLDKKVVHFVNIGQLYFNADSKLEFLPEKTNFLRAAYGLPTLSCQPILRNKDYLQANATAPVIARRSKIALFWSPARLAAAAAVLLLLVGGPYLYRNFSNPQPATDPALVAEETTTPPATSTPVQAAILPEWSAPTPAVDSTVTIEAEPIEEAPIADPIETEEEAVPNGEDYLIVLGAFGKERNATRLAKRLAKDNYLPDVTLKNGLHRVGVQLNCSPEELKEHLAFLKEAYNPKAWVLD